MKVLDSAKYLQKDFLGGIGGIGWITDQPVNQAIDGLLKLCD